MLKTTVAPTTRDEMRDLINAVLPGECVTYPNGIVVDKRPFPPSFTTQPWNGGPSYPFWGVGGGGSGGTGRPEFT